MMGVPPDFLDVEFDIAAEVYWCVFLAHAEALVVLESLEGSAVVAHIFDAPLDHDEVLVDLRRRSPVPMILVAGPGARQPVGRTELVDRAGFAVVPGPDAGFGTLLGRQRIVNGGNLAHHFRPAELVGNRLRQQRLLVHFGLRGFETDSVLISEETFRR